ncbi:MAG TPA: hypothetical protein VLM91_00670, partial [Candidatus Methylomirabilis sp.]|nr:hypothetical protein [Candidatus Methylomirabilis sp.]
TSPRPFRSRVANRRWPWAHSELTESAISGYSRLPRRLLDELEYRGHLVELAEGSVSVEQVSGGEREQIYLATRLALPEVLARGERQLVVPDDVLTATDTGRLARVMGILEEAAQRLQVLFLTCHPERYRGLAGANFVDLEAILRGDDSAR